MYRIATAPKTIYPDQYFMRKQFEEALVYQAAYMIKNGNSAEVSRFYMNNGQINEPAVANVDEGNRVLSDISPECLNTLETLGLLRWFTLGQFTRLDPDEY